MREHVVRYVARHKHLEAQDVTHTGNVAASPSGSGAPGVVKSAYYAQQWACGALQMARPAHIAWYLACQGKADKSAVCIWTWRPTLRKRAASSQRQKVTTEVCTAFQRHLRTPTAGRVCDHSASLIGMYICRACQPTHAVHSRKSHHPFLTDSRLLLHATTQHSSVAGLLAGHTTSVAHSVDQEQPVLRRSTVCAGSSDAPFVDQAHVQ